MVGHEPFHKSRNDNQGLNRLEWELSIKEEKKKNQT